MWETWCSNILLIVKNNETLPDIWLCLSSPHGSTVALRKHHCFISGALGQRWHIQPVQNLLSGRDVAVRPSFLCSGMVVMLNSRLGGCGRWVRGQLAATVQRAVWRAGWVVVTSRTCTSLLCVATCITLVLQNAYSQFPSLPFLFDFWLYLESKTGYTVYQGNYYKKTHSKLKINTNWNKMLNH